MLAADATDTPESARRPCLLPMLPMLLVANTHCSCYPNSPTALAAQTKCTRCPKLLPTLPTAFHCPCCSLLTTQASPCPRCSLPKLLAAHDAPCQCCSLPTLLVAHTTHYLCALFTLLTAQHACCRCLLLLRTAQETPYYTCVGCVRATRFGGILELTPHIVSNALRRHPHRVQTTSNALLQRHPRVCSLPFITHRNIALQQDLASAGFCLARSVRDLHPALTPSRQSTTEYRYSFGPSVLR